MDIKLLDIYSDLSWMVGYLSTKNDEWSERVFEQAVETRQKVLNLMEETNA